MGNSHISDWHPGKVSKGYKDNYGKIEWETLENESPTDATVKSEKPRGKNIREGWLAPAGTVGSKHAGVRD